MASADGSWSKGKFYSAKMQQQLSQAQREQLERNELDISAGKYAKMHAKATIATEAEHSSEREAMRATRQQARQVAERLRQEQPKRQVGRGRVVRAYGTDPRNRYELRYEIREMDDLVTSNTSSGAVNPEYPRELQPRDRTRVASEMQVDEIARQMEPDAYLDEFKSTDRGAPIVGDDNAVESGNGRTMALRRAVERYPEQYDEYKRRLAEVAAEHGIDPDDLKRYKNPVLVRTHVGEYDRVKFAQEANSRTTLEMSDVERAKSDAAAIQTRDIVTMEMDDTGNVDAALKRPGNRELVRSFVSRLPDNERASMMTREGELTQAGSRRIRAAMFARVYDDTRIGERMFESTDDETKNLSAGIMGSLGRMAQSEELVRTGQRAGEFSMAGDIAQAVGTLQFLKERKMSLDDYIAQSQMFERRTTPTQERIMVALNERRRSSKQVREFIAGWSELVEAQPPPGQGMMFGGMAKSRDELVDEWLARDWSGKEDKNAMFAGRLF